MPFIFYLLTRLLTWSTFK